ncbi:hypothetical protein GCM10007967_32360 [Xylanimonas ulmi]|uniref:HNH endonuclease n=1 Tax=Xylanimonas ulmi TaxID=228973 RepID=A0A4Q7M010_9MICO|nr:hypothetical protein EV386_0709 [Xylanibacterium ulmi]
MSAKRQWAGESVRRARAVMRPRLPLPCWWCKQPVLADAAWVVEHIVARSVRPDLAHDPSNWWVSHRRCSDASGGRLGAKRKAAVVEATTRLERDVRPW